ncbi:MAG: tRNA lysidine(34) synthetase TilS [Rickettsiales bacterium]
MEETPFSTAMEALALLPAPKTMAVAVSGGADSMALTLLAHRWAEPRGITLHALTVDHGLREDSAEEAAQVAQWLGQQGIPHHTLTLNLQNASENNLQAAAREGRYDAMAHWCKAHEVAHLLIAHHLEDQAETFLIRLGRGSGVDGLSAMQPATHRDGITLLRPLLSTSKADLRDFLKAQNQSWIEDPSNQNPAFTRIRMRALLPLLEEAGISAQTLANTATRMQRARHCLEAKTEAAMAACLHATEETLVLQRVPFSALHPEIGLRVLAEAIAHISGQHYRPRFAKLERLYHAIIQENSPVACTLSGCLFRSDSCGEVTICLEHGNQPHPASCG